MSEQVWPWPSSNTVDLVLGAYVKACGMMTDVARDREAKVQGKEGKAGYQYTYADLASAMEVARPKLCEHGLSVSQPPTIDGRDVVVTTLVLHESGQWISFPPLSMPAGNTAQNTGSAITYARRYSLLPALGVATEDDDGANAGTRNEQAQQQVASTGPQDGNEAVRVVRLINDGRRANQPAYDDLVRFAAENKKEITVRALVDPAWRGQVEAAFRGFMEQPAVDQQEINMAADEAPVEPQLPVDEKPARQPATPRIGSPAMSDQWGCSDGVTVDPEPERTLDGQTSIFDVLEATA